jgi:hypothetical protein
VNLGVDAKRLPNCRFDPEFSQVRVLIHNTTARRGVENARWGWCCSLVAIRADTQTDAGNAPEPNAQSMFYTGENK